MDKMLEKLKEYGADVDGAMGRFLDDIDLYKTCFKIFLDDKSFPSLNDALSVMDYEKAFECAHTLKGVSGNMGLTPLYQVICSMVDELRNNEYSNLQKYYTEIVDQLDRLKRIQE